MEIGRVDIITEVSIMKSRTSMPREVHLEAVSHVFLFICQKYNSRIALDPTYPAINMSDFKEFKCRKFHVKLK